MTQSNVEGIVEAFNEKGIKLNGEWLNWSQFATQRWAAGRGDHVRLKLDTKGFIRELESLGGNPATESPAVSRDDRITRLAVLKAAAGFVGRMGQSREDVNSSHVLQLADKWLAWVEEN